MSNKHDNLTNRNNGNNHDNGRASKRHKADRGYVCLRPKVICGIIVFRQATQLLAKEAILAVAPII